MQDWPEKLVYMTAKVCTVMQMGDEVFSMTIAGSACRSKKKTEFSLSDLDIYSGYAESIICGTYEIHVRFHMLG